MAADGSTRTFAARRWWRYALARAAIVLAGLARGQLRPVGEPHRTAGQAAVSAGYAFGQFSVRVADEPIAAAVMLLSGVPRSPVIEHRPRSQRLAAIRR